MPGPLALAVPSIITTVGRYAAPYLVKQAVKIGKDQFVNTYGSKAFESINNLNIQSKDLFKKDSEEETKDSSGLSTETSDAISNVQKKDSELPEPKKEPPKGPDIGTELATEAAVQTTKKLLEDKKPDVSNQTKELVPEKPEFGDLTKAETQTAKALKEGKPDFYSRAVDAIKNAKQNKFTKGKWKSIVQSNSTKNEMKYLGLDKYLQGNESITKEELLKFVEKKDIAPNITVRSIPKDQMNPMYEGYSLGGDQEHIVFQFGKIPSAKELFTDRPYESEVTPLFKSEHFDTEYGTNTFAHTRVQVGFDKGFSAKYDDLSSEVIDTLNNTLIIDEIQSDYIQRGQDNGFIGDFDIVPEDKLIEYLEKNNIFYKLSKPPFADKESGVKVIEWQQSGPIKPGDAPKMDTLNVGYDKNFIFNKSDKTHYVTTGEDINPVQYLTDEGIVPDFPIKESKKFVELVLNKMIEKAVLDGRDSIAITNGQIQANRYDAMTDEDKEGLKKFYDTIVYDQLNKIAKEYGVELETINIQNPDDIEGGSEEEDNTIQFPMRVKNAQTAGYTLQKLSGEILDELVNNRNLPGHASIYSNEGKGQGLDYIMNILGNVNKYEDNYYVWTKNNISEDINNLNVFKNFEDVVWDMPIVPVNDTPTNLVVKDLLKASSEDREFILRRFTIGGEAGYPYAGENINNTDLIQYTEYLRNYKPPEGVDLGYDKDAEQLIKMKLPKRLQKDSLSKPIKLSKIKKQTNKMMA